MLPKISGWYHNSSNKWTQLKTKAELVTALKGYRVQVTSDNQIALNSRFLGKFQYIQAQK